MFIRAGTLGTHGTLIFYVIPQTIGEMVVGRLLCLYTWNRMDAFFASERPAEFRAIHEKCHFDASMRPVESNFRALRRISPVSCVRTCNGPARTARFIFQLFSI
ncbi:MAG: hypothetical protein IJJ80_00525 [Clostridia bacterium]|nr:hypothetical protein [Clostridia bacterium]